MNRMNKKQHKIITLLVIVVFILAFMLGNRVFFRIDLTRDRVYTLSALSRNLHREIIDIMRITYYVSDRLASIHPAPEEISGFLREYAAHSRGKIQFVRRDPARTGMARDIEMLGVNPQAFRIIENNEITTATVYSGIVIEYLDRVEVLPFVLSLNTLEYDITTRALFMARGRDRILGVMVADIAKSWHNDFILLDTALNQAGYRIRQIIPGDEIPDTLPVLFVLGGVEDLDEWALYRIDRYIQLGGRVLFAIEPLYMDLSAGLDVRHAMDQGLSAIVASYGAGILPALVLDRLSLNISYQIRDNVSQTRTVPYPHWLALLEHNGNIHHPITQRFAGINLYWASHLIVNPPDGIIAETLITSSPDAWLQIQNFHTNPEFSDLFELEAAQTRGQKIMAAAFSGIFPSAFRDFPKPVREGYGAELPDLPAIARPSRIVVVGDTDFASALMEIGQGEGMNLNFLVRTADWLGNDDDIMNLRHGDRGRLDRIADERTRWAVMNFSRNLNIIVMPLLIIITGIVVTGKRKKMTIGKKNAAGKST